MNWMSIAASEIEYATMKADPLEIGKTIVALKARERRAQGGQGKSDRVRQFPEAT